MTAAKMVPRSLPILSTSVTMPTVCERCGHTQTHTMTFANPNAAPASAREWGDAAVDAIAATAERVCYDSGYLRQTGISIDEYEQRRTRVLIRAGLAAAAPRAEPNMRQFVPGTVASADRVLSAASPVADQSAATDTEHPSPRNSGAVGSAADPAAIVARLRKQATCIYIAVEKTIADDIAECHDHAAALIVAQQARIESLARERDELGEESARTVAMLSRQVDRADKAEAERDKLRELLRHAINVSDHRWHNCDECKAAHDAVYGDAALKGEA